MEREHSLSRGQHEHERDYCIRLNNYLRRTRLYAKDSAKLLCLEVITQAIKDGIREQKGLPSNNDDRSASGNERIRSAHEFLTQDDSGLELWLSMVDGNIECTRKTYADSLEQGRLVIRKKKQTHGAKIKVKGYIDESMEI